MARFSFLPILLSLIIFIDISINTKSLANSCLEVLTDQTTSSGFLKREKPSTKDLSPKEIKAETLAHNMWIEETRSHIKSLGRQELEHITRTIKDGQIPQYDVVVIGAGIQSAAVVSGIRASAPNAKILVVEKSNFFGVFDRYGPSFEINTRETNRWSENPITGSPLQLEHINWNNQTYILSNLIGDATIASFYKSSVPAIFHKTAAVTGRGTSKNIWRVSLGDGVEITSTHVVKGTGFGIPKTDFESPKSAEQLHAAFLKHSDNINKGLFDYDAKIEVVDTLLPRLARLFRQHEAGKTINPFQRYSGKTIIVVGSGHGAYILISAIAQLSAGLKGKESTRILPKKIIWFSQKATNAKEFVDGLHPSFKKRYNNISALFDMNLIESIPNRAVEFNENKKTGRIEVKEKDTQRQVSGDYLYTAIGYKDLTSEALKTITDNSSNALEPTPVYLDINAFTNYKSGENDKTISGDMIGEKESAIWLIGSASPSLNKGINDLFPKYRGGFIDIQSPRSASIGLRIGEQVSVTNPNSIDKTILNTANKSKFTSSFSVSKSSKVDIPTHTLRNKLRVEIARVLRAFFTSHEADVSIKFALNSEKVSIDGLELKSAKLLIDHLAQNTNILQILASFKQKAVKSVFLTIPTRPNGSIRWEEMVINYE